MATSTIKSRKDRLIVNGDDIIVTGVFPGYISGSAKSIAIGVDFAQMVDKGTSAHISLTQLKGALRGITGYLAGTTNDTDILQLPSVSSISAAACSAPSGQVLITITFTDALSTTNNSPVVFSGTVEMVFS